MASARPRRPLPALPTASPLPTLVLPDDAEAHLGADSPVLPPAQATDPRASEARASASSNATPAAAQPTGGYARISCAACAQPLAGRVISALDRRWHVDCFKCAHCSIALEHVELQGHEGQLYCALDYYELFAPKCAHCHGPIMDPDYVALEAGELGPEPRVYHQVRWQSHFWCAECGDPFLDPKSTVDDPIMAPFVVVAGHPYCGRCHDRLFAPKCSFCRKPLEGEVLDALGRQYHAMCFACTTCRTSFETGTFLAHAGEAFCERCFAARLAAEL